MTFVDQYNQPPQYEADPLLKKDSFSLISEELELAGGAIKRLQKLSGYDIVFVLDDSGSMSQVAHVSSDPSIQPISRWDELRERVKQILRIALCLDKDGVSLYFLNRPDAHNITMLEEVDEHFINPPRGYTPLREAYNRALQGCKTETKTLIIIATDGQPNYKSGGAWYIDTDKFYETIKNRRSPHMFPTCIMGCTDEEADMEWLNKFDDSCPYLDVVDDYDAELKEVRNVQGYKFPFSKGDYLVKTILGSVDRLYDHLDEKYLNDDEFFAYTGRKRYDYEKVETGCGCTIC